MQNSQQEFMEAAEKLKQDIVKAQKIMENPKRSVSKQRVMELLASCLQVIDHLPVQVGQLAYSARAMQGQLAALTDWIRVVDIFNKEEELYSTESFNQAYDNIVEKPQYAATLLQEEYNKLLKEYDEARLDETKAAVEEKVQGLKKRYEELENQTLSRGENMVVEGIIAEFGKTEELDEQAQEVIEKAKEEAKEAVESNQQQELLLEEPTEAAVA